LMHGSIPVCVRGVCVSVRLFHSQYMCACGQAGEAKGCLHARCLHATCVQMPACKMRACNRNACFNVLERETHRNRHTGGWSWAGDRHAPTACRGARQSQCTRHPLRQRTALFPPRLWAGPGITHTSECVCVFMCVCVCVIDGQTDRQTDRQTDGQTDRQTDGHGKNKCLFLRHERVQRMLTVE
jgi:hypothetical protein